MQPQRPFDEVRFPTLNGTASLTLEAFLELKLPDRVKIILDGRAVFSLNGVALPKREALARLKSWAGDGNRSAR